MYYDKRNVENINKLAPNTRAKVLEWYEYCKKNNIDILIYETLRTEEQQKEYVRTGKSQTMKSYHLVGQALDFVPVNSKGQTLWNGYDSIEIKQAIQYAKQLGFEWGGDWKSFVDKPHLQFNYKGYGTDKVLTVEVKEKKVEQMPEEMLKPSGYTLQKSVEYALYRMELEGMLQSKWRQDYLEGKLSQSNAIAILFHAITEGFVHNKYSNK